MRIRTEKNQPILRESSAVNMIENAQDSWSGDVNKTGLNDLNQVFNTQTGEELKLLPIPEDKRYWENKNNQK